MFYIETHEVGWNRAKCRSAEKEKTKNVRFRSLDLIRYKNNLNESKRYSNTNCFLRYYNNNSGDAIIHFFSPSNETDFYVRDGVLLLAHSLARITGSRIKSI